LLRRYRRKVDVDREDLMFGLFGSGKGKTAKTPEARKAEHDELIFKIAQYVCAVSPGQPMRLLAVGGSLDTSSTSGEAGFQYQIKTDSGFGNLFIFPKYASVWMLDEPEPRHPLPMHMIEEYLEATEHPERIPEILAKLMRIEM
jgi:hypothetical protein